MTSSKGGPGRDELLGQDGDDTFNGRGPTSMLAVDVIVGGDGPDGALYDSSPVGVRVNMSSGLVLADGVSERGGIQSVTVLIGSEHDDELIGDARPNRISGLAGNDFIQGRGSGGDSLRGGRGTDRLSYAKTPEPVDVLLFEDTTIIGTRGARTDHIDGFESVVGSAFDDELRADNVNTRISGGPGDDVIKGGSGDDILEGGAGDDSIHPGRGDDFVDGGPNDPVTNRNHPGDLVSYLHEKLPTPAPGKPEEEFHVDLGPPFGPGASGIGDDRFAGIESVRGLKNESNFLDGDDGPNVLIGGKKEDYIRGSGGDDHLFGLGFPDNLWGDDGDDFLDPGGNGELIDGGDGSDTCVHRDEDLSTSCETAGR